MTKLGAVLEPISFGVSIGPTMILLLKTVEIPGAFLILKPFVQTFLGQIKCSNRQNKKKR